MSDNLYSQINLECGIYIIDLKYFDMERKSLYDTIIPTFPSLSFI